MSKEEGLLEVLTHKVGAGYISDLRKEDFRKELVRCIKGMESTEYPINEWLDVLDYLTGEKQDINDPEDCKKTLLKLL